MTEKKVEPIDPQDEDIRKLLLLSGPRLQPPAALEDRVRAATMAAVADLPDPESEQRSRQAFKHLIPLAALLVVTALAGVLMLPASNTDVAGEITFATGGYTVRGSDEPGNRIAAGAIVRTSGSGRLLIDLKEERTLRMDHNARLTLRGPSEVWLHAGRIFLDSRGGSPITVVTPNASIRDVGTQFEVLVEGESLEVATREGTVDVSLWDRSIRSSAAPDAGEVLEFSGLSLVSRSAVTPNAPRWAWISQARPLFAVQGRTLREYLEWHAREAGYALRFHSPLVAQQASLRTLGGRGEVDADPATLHRVLAGTPFTTLPGEEYEIVVGLKEADDRSR